MRAALLTRYGDVDALEIREIEARRAGSGQAPHRRLEPERSRLKLIGGGLGLVPPQARPSSASTRRARWWAPGVTGLGSATRSSGGCVTGGRVRHHSGCLLARSRKAPLVDAAAIRWWRDRAQLIQEAVRPSQGLRPGDRCARGVGVVMSAALGARVIAGVRAAALRGPALGADVVALDDRRRWAAAPLDGIADTVGGETVLRLLQLAPMGCWGPC